MPVAEMMYLFQNSIQQVLLLPGVHIMGGVVMISVIR